MPGVLPAQSASRFSAYRKIDFIRFHWGSRRLGLAALDLKDPSDTHGHVGLRRSDLHDHERKEEKYKRQRGDDYPPQAAGSTRRVRPHRLMATETQS
jgi:hypothetical protein